MEYRLKIGEDILPLTCEKGEDNLLKMENKGKPSDVRWTSVSPYQIHLALTGINRNAYISDGPDGKTVLLNGIVYAVQDADRQERNSHKKGKENLPRKITPPMPSVVVRILVAEGDAVEKGQGVAVVSAMKMESTLNAPFTGRVRNIHVAEGDRVSLGQILMDIEEEK